MRNPFIAGEKIQLRGIERSDLEGAYFDWLNDSEVTKYIESGNFPNSVEKMEVFYRDTIHSSDNVLFGIIENGTNKHIGNVKLGPINWINRSARIGIMIGDKESWGKGYGAEAIDLVLGYAFKRLNLHKVSTFIAEINQASVKMFKKVGFSTEGQAKKEFFLDGEYSDLLYIGITKDEYLQES